MNELFKNFFIFAGESSGDLIGSRLMKALKKQKNEYFFDGVGGPLMRAAGLHALVPMEEFQVMGFSDVFLSLPKLVKNFYRVLNFILKNEIDCVILIDYPGFNLRLAKKLRRRGYKGKIVQYVSPSVWAHGKDRIDSMSKTLDLLLVIYPFEIDCFTNTKLPVKFVGNPLIETINHYDYNQDWYKEVGLHDTENLISIFPGSRKGEIKRMLPDQLKAAELFKQKHPEAKFAISYLNNELFSLILGYVFKSHLKIGLDVILVPKKFTYELMKDSRISLAKSGTVTLELALHQCPTVVVYKLSAFNYLIAKYMLKLNLPHYCIVNIISKGSVFPEIMGTNLDAHDIVKQLEILYSDSSEREATIKACASIQRILTLDHASQNAAQAIKEVL